LRSLSLAELKKEHTLSRSKMTFVCSPARRFLFDESVKAAHGVGRVRPNPAGSFGLARNDLTFFFAMKQNGLWSCAQRIGARMSGSPQERAARRTAPVTPNQPAAATRERLGKIPDRRSDRNP
jgi:hypothetical protein